MRVGAYLRLWGVLDPRFLYRREGIGTESDPRTMSIPSFFFVSKQGELR